MNPVYPIYIPSKGRAAYQMTSRYLSAAGIPHNIIVEEQERKDYEATATPLATIITLDPSYRDRHETLDDFGHTRPFGAGPARNMAWDLAIASGAAMHWDMDDNIRGFWRFNYNRKIPVADGTTLRCIEAFVERYDNIALAGPNYYMFAPARVKLAHPFVLNTRIYSCTLIRNDIPFRWRLRMNEDTDLSLQVLKAGWCTVQFYAFLAQKETTQKMPGGYNTPEFYADKSGDHQPDYHVHAEACRANPHRLCRIPEGWCCDDHARRSTQWKSQMLVDAHPDVARITYRFGRWHHYVDYSGFTQQLHRRPGVVVKPGVDNFGMILEKLDHETGVWRQIATPWDDGEWERY